MGAFITWSVTRGTTDFLVEFSSPPGGPCTSPAYRVVSYYLLALFKVYPNPNLLCILEDGDLLTVCAGGLCPDVVAPVAGVLAQVAVRRRQEGLGLPHREVPRLPRPELLPHRRVEFRLEPINFKFTIFSPSICFKILHSPQWCKKDLTHGLLSRSRSSH